MFADASGKVPEKELLRLREYLAGEKRDFKMEDALEALKRAKEIAEE